MHLLTNRLTLYQQSVHVNLHKPGGLLASAVNVASCPREGELQGQNFRLLRQSQKVTV